MEKSILSFFKTSIQYFNRRLPLGLNALSLLLLASIAINLTHIKPAFAQSDKNSITQLKNKLEERWGVESVIQSINTTPYSGLYEVVINGDVMYSDANGNYLFIGQIIDTKTRKNYTMERVQQLEKNQNEGFKFSELPFRDAIKTVNGNGQRVVVVFEDPYCGYCKRLRQTLQKLDNITIYSFLYPILSEDSVEKSSDIWCAPNASQAFNEWMLKEKNPPKAAANCSSPNQKVLQLGRQLKVTGTPTLFFSDGSRITGAIPLDTLQKKLDSIYADKK